MTAAKLLSTDLKLIKEFNSAFGAKAEFYDSFDSNFDTSDLIFWDTSTVSPQIEAPGRRIVGLYKELQKGIHFYAFKNQFYRWEKVPTDSQSWAEFATLPNERIAIADQLERHYDLFLQSHIDNYLMLPNGSKILNQLWELTQDRFEKDIPTFKSLVIQNKLEDINRLAHKNKSTCGNAGCWRLHVLCHWLELASGLNDVSLSKKLIVDLLNDTYNTTVKAWPNP
ncbi:Hpt domain-containing protein [Oligoflexaceae bacterium]|nr:Hpt domain-containing protein [Oligoflexaceae bacterium]